MRMLFGIVVGVMLTVGVAFIADSAAGPGATTGSGSATLDHRRMVNWDVVGDNVRIARERANEVWARISHKIAS